MTIYRLFCKIVRGLLVLAVTVTAGIVALLAVMWLDHTRVTTLPTPTGPFAVGRIAYDWTDAMRPDTMAQRTDHKREIFAWVWYPAVPQISGKEADYLPASWRIAVEQQRGTLINKFLTRDLSRVRSQSFDGAGVSRQEPSYSVILMQAGFSATLAEDLASHGFVVVGVNAPYRSGIVVFPDGRVIKAAPQNKLADHGPPQMKLATELIKAGSIDMSVALDKLEQLNSSDPSGKFLGKLNMHQVGVFGWSIGGATALQFCHDDQRCKAAIDIDGYPLGSAVTEGVDQPVLFLMEDLAKCDSEAECRQIETNIRAISNKEKALPKEWISIRGANHFMFSDDGAILKSPALVKALSTLGIVHIRGRRQIAVAEHCISTFFDAHLKAVPPLRMRETSAYPEIVEMH